MDEKATQHFWALAANWATAKTGEDRLRTADTLERYVRFLIGNAPRTETSVPKIGWTMTERVGIPFANLNFKGYSFEESQNLVQEGLARWVLGHCNTLTIEPRTYALKEFEHFLNETEVDGRIVFEVLK